MNRLQGLAALVSGGAGDIGGAIASAFEAEGASVLAVDLRVPETQEGLRFQHLDVTSESDWTAAVGTAELPLAALTSWSTQRAWPPGADSTKPAGTSGRRR